MTDDITCPPPDPDCLWRVAGVSRRLGIERKILGLVRAPAHDQALRIALARYGAMYRDISVSPDPLANV